MSVFAVPVVQMQGFGKHPNADTLSIINVEGVLSATPRPSQTGRTIAKLVSESYLLRKGWSERH